MAKIAEYAELRTQYGIFRDWLEVTCEWSYDAPVYRSFQLRCAEPSKKGDLLRLKPGDRVDIALAGELFIREGYIKARQVGHNGRQHFVQVNGMSKHGKVVDVSAEVKGGQFKKKILQEICTQVLKPHGIKFRLQGANEAAMEPFRNFIVMHGESPWSIVERACRQKGVWVRPEPDGTFVAGDENAGGGAILELGKNILAGNSYIEDPRVNQVLVDSQAKGSDEEGLFGRKAAEARAKAMIGGGDSAGKLIMLAEEQLTSKEAKARANMETSKLIEALIRAAITHQGFLRPGVGGLWKPQEVVLVKDEWLFPLEGGQIPLKVYGFTYHQDSESGTTGTVELRNPAMFSMKFGDGIGGGTDVTPQQAQPEGL